jgi:hypothetical protein
VKEVLAKHFGGVAVSKQNLSEWRAGGFAEWEARQELLATTGELAADAEEIKTATKGKLADHLGTVLTARYAALVAEWNGEVTEGFQKKLKALRGMCQDIVQLRKADHSGLKLEIIENQQELEREKGVGEIIEFFQEWLKIPAVCELASNHRKTARQKEREWQELFAWAKSPEARGEVLPDGHQGKRSLRTATEGESTSGTGKVPPSEEDEEQSNPVKPGQSSCVGAKRKKAKGKAPRSSRPATEGESTKGQAPSTGGTAKVPPSENENEDEKGPDGRPPESNPVKPGQSRCVLPQGESTGETAAAPTMEDEGLADGHQVEVDPVKLVQAEIERVRWAKRDDCKY